MGKGRGPQDPFGTYREWSEHRYDPGHYLGGTIAPHLRKSALGPRARRLSGGMLFLGGCASLLMLLPDWRGGVDDLSTGLAYLDAVLRLGLSSLLIFAGVAMYRSGPRRGSKRRQRD